MLVSRQNTYPSQLITRIVQHIKQLQLFIVYGLYHQIFTITIHTTTPIKLYTDHYTMNTLTNTPQNTMVRNLRYRLALDIGTTSLGWCILRINPNNEPYAIVKMGVRIFSDGRVPKSGESLAVTRRTARLQRRRRDRLVKRKAQMERALVDFNFWSINTKERLSLAILDPYALRAKGLDSLLTPAEFGRAIFHLNQRRGFKSNRKTDQSATDSTGKEVDTGALKEAITALKTTLNTQ
ncbi:MAG: hypothetical protein RI956_674, partial [Pseudomonadota bacterium]